MLFTDDNKVAIKFVQESKHYGEEEKHADRKLMLLPAHWLRD